MYSGVTIFGASKGLGGGEGQILATRGTPRLLPKSGKWMTLAALAIFSEPVFAQETNETSATAPSPAIADEVATPANQDDINFAADKVEYDTNTEIVTATGNVRMNRQGYRLRADQVLWNRKSGEVKANGNVASTSPNGDAAYGETITLTDSLRDGIVENLLVVLENGGRLAAQSGERREDGSMSLQYAAYSPCKVVDKDNCPKNPSWQVQAVRVDYDPIKKRVKYKGARIELFGLPLIPLPGLAHAVDNVAGSGFLVPSAKFSRSNGLEVEVPYYWRLGDNKDITASITGFTKVAPLVQAKFRSLEDRGALEISGYATYGSRQSADNNNTTNGNRSFRGYIDAVGRLQFDANWSLSGSLRAASDRTFLRRYDISRDDRLRNNISLERIDQKSYFAISGWAIQTLRTGENQKATPIALPEIDYRLRLQNPILGGKLQLQANSLAIGRIEGQDTQRAFASAEWNTQRLTGMGQELSFTLLGRGDLYNSDENADTPTALYRGESGFKARAIAGAAADIKWPFIGSAFGGTQILTPRVQFVGTTVSSNLDVPNEDSRSIDLEETNLFSINRFPGYDRFEDNVRMTLGVDWSLTRDDMTIKASIGQSFRLSNSSDILPDGTGLSEKLSDIVGRTDIRYKNFISLTHRFRIDKDDLNIRRNELDATIGGRGTYAQIGYLRLNRNITGLEDLPDREEIRLAGRAKIARYWSIFGSTIIDLTDEKEDPFTVADGFEPIRHRLGVAYDDDCLSLSVTWRRDYQSTGDALRGNSFLFRLAFRNLGV